MKLLLGLKVKEKKCYLENMNQQIKLYCDCVCRPVSSHWEQNLGDEKKEPGVKLPHSFALTS